MIWSDMTRKSQTHRELDLTQRKSLIGKITLAIIVVGFLLAGCGEAKPTINPDPTTTRPAITQTVPATIESQTPTQEPTRRPTETPAQRPFVLYKDMSAEGGPAQCAQNTIDLDRPDVDQQMATMIQSIRNQVGAPDGDVLLRITPGAIPGITRSLWPELPFTFQTLHGDRAPILGCGEARQGENRARIQVFDLPFPDGTFVTIGLVSETGPLETILAEKLDYLGDENVFRVLQRGSSQVYFQVFIDDASYALAHGGSPENQQSNNQYRQNLRDQLGVTLLPPIFDALEAQNFSQYFIEVFFDGNLTHLEELRAIMQGKLIPGYIMVDESRP
jgi:hypothetical protein